MKRKLNRRLRLRLILCGVCLLLSVVCFLIFRHLSCMLPAQAEAERWRGEGEQSFSQVSCFLPTDGKIALKDVAAFRSSAMTALKSASQNVSGDQQLMLDAWSTTARVNVATSFGKGEATAIAVGGNFFDFHPLSLISGDYLHPSDLMQDRVLLDEDLAWLLFGGTDLQGMELRLNGQPYVVAGVVRIEQDFASRRADKEAGMMLFMSYDALLRLDSATAISCYEYVLSNPVENFAVSVAREKFPVGRGVILENSDRFGYGKMMNLIFRYGSRSTQTTGVIFPYWENAARVVEDYAGLCCLLGTLLLLYPAFILLLYLGRFVSMGRKRFTEEFLPRARESTEEAVRIHQRRLWEKRHGLHNKK